MANSPEEVELLLLKEWQEVMSPGPLSRRAALVATLSIHSGIDVFVQRDIPVFCCMRRLSFVITSARGVVCHVCSYREKRTLFIEFSGKTTRNPTLDLFHVFIWKEAMKSACKGRRRR